MSAKKESMAQDSSSGVGLAVAPVMEQAAEQYYHIGVLPEAPFSFVTVAGVAFHQYTDPPVMDGRTKGHMITDRYRIDGQILPLSKAKVNAIREALSHKIVRDNRILNTNTTEGDSRHVRYRSIAGDTPLAKFLYMKTVAGTPEPVQRPPSPPSLLEDASALQ